MKFEIRSDVLFHVHDGNALNVALKIGYDEIAEENLSFEQILKNSLRGLSKSERRQEKRKIAEAVRAFLDVLESSPVIDKSEKPRKDK